MAEKVRPTLRSENEQLERKLRTVKSVVLGIILFIIADIIGRWFLPEGETVPGMFLAMTWCISIALGFIMHYGYRAISRPGMKIAAALVFYILYLLLLYICRFFRYDNPALTGYHISIAILPVFGAVICLTVKKFLRWYGGLVKKVFHLQSVNSILFFAAMAVLCILVVLVFIGGYRLNGFLGQQGLDLYQLHTEGEINHNTDHSEPYRNYAQIFSDLNEVQLEAARKNGLKEPVSQEDVEGNRKLRKIESNRYYNIDELTHSMPYLVPKATGLVEDIGRAFQDSLFNRGYNRNHRITVTSVLRTRELVRQLQKTNVNSTTNSCHCYGTTVDISYLTFQTPEVGKAASPEKMRQILMEVMYDLRNEGRCFVKYEKQQTCLHITVR